MKQRTILGLIGTVLFYAGSLLLLLFCGNIIITKEMELMFFSAALAVLGLLIIGLCINTKFSDEGEKE